LAVAREGLPAVLRAQRVGWKAVAQGLWVRVHALLAAAEILTVPVSPKTSRGGLAQMIGDLPAGLSSLLGLPRAALPARLVVYLEERLRECHRELRASPLHDLLKAESLRGVVYADSSTVAPIVLVCDLLETLRYRNAEAMHQRVMSGEAESGAVETGGEEPAESDQE
jgi:hypothetical protein